MRRGPRGHRPDEPLGRRGQAEGPALHLPRREVDDRARVPHPARVAARHRGGHALPQLPGDGLRRAEPDLRADGAVEPHAVHGGPRVRGRADGERERRRRGEPRDGELPQGLEPSGASGPAVPRRIARLPRGGLPRGPRRVRLVARVPHAGVRSAPALRDHAHGRRPRAGPDLRGPHLRPLHGVRQELPRRRDQRHGEGHDDDRRPHDRVGQARRERLRARVPLRRHEARAESVRRRLLPQLRLRHGARGQLRLRARLHGAPRAQGEAHASLPRAVPPRGMAAVDRGPLSAAAAGGVGGARVCGAPASPTTRPRRPPSPRRRTATTRSSTDAESLP